MWRRWALFEIREPGLQLLLDGLVHLPAHRRQSLHGFLQAHARCLRSCCRDEQVCVLSGSRPDFLTLPQKRHAALDAHLAGSLVRAPGVARLCRYFVEQEAHCADAARLAISISIACRADRRQRCKGVMLHQGRPALLDGCEYSSQSHSCSLQDSIWRLTQLQHVFDELVVFAQSDGRRALGKCHGTNGPEYVREHRRCKHCWRRALLIA